MKKLAYLFFIVFTTIAVSSCSKDDAESEPTRCYFEDLRKANGSPEITYTTENGRQCKQIEYNIQTDTLQYHCQENKLIGYSESYGETFAKILSLFDGEKWSFEKFGEPPFNYRLMIQNGNNSSQFTGEIMFLYNVMPVTQNSISVKFLCFH